MNNLESLETMNASENEIMENYEKKPLPAENLEDQSASMDLASTEASAQESSDKHAGNHEATDNKSNPHRQHFEKFLAELEKLPDSEAKLQFGIDFMESSLAQSGTPHFKSFWEARSICLQLFKDNIQPALRSLLWTKYNELSKEARRLKEILDEQSAFAVEQIEIAVKALEDDINAFKEHLEKVASIEFDVPSRILAPHIADYQNYQRELNLLNAQASRINSMRKELIRTEMRVRQKNKFFQRLSAAGDKVFPHRKDLIKEVSQRFINDVETFVTEHFSSESHASLFSLREEIKALQNMAKVLTLNTHAFTQTRMRLSECWDKLKGEEKERKKERAQQKIASKQILDQALEKLNVFNTAFKADEVSTGDAMKQIEVLGQEFRALDLAREERTFLKDEFFAVKNAIAEKHHAEENARAHQGQEKERARRQKFHDLKAQIADLIKLSDATDVDALEAKRAELLESFSESNLTKMEKQEIERQLKPLRDIISEKKENSLLALSDDDKQSLIQLKEVLKQKKERRQEAKEQVDNLRKLSGSSGLDFEQAMNYNTQIATEKERLEKINQGIKEIEQTISRLERR